MIRILKKKMEPTLIIESQSFVIYQGRDTRQSPSFLSKCDVISCIMIGRYLLNPQTTTLVVFLRTIKENNVAKGEIAVH